MARALLIVDFQNDFTAGGALEVPGGEEIAAPMNALAREHDHVVATRDWHPPDHGSFEGVEVDPERWDGREPPNIWPVHCVAGTEGAELHPDLDQGQVDLVLDKGQDPHSQGYSAFQGTDLAERLRQRGVDEIIAGGLATNLCVKHTVLDALSEGFEVAVVEDAIRGVDLEPGDAERALDEMREAGARVASSSELLAEPG